MHTPVPLLPGDLIIRRVSNGWYVARLDQFDDGSPRLDETVFSDEEFTKHDHADALSLMSALYEAFKGYIHRKRRGGIEMKFHEKGWDS